MRKEKWNYSLDELKNAVSKSICYSDVCRELNITICTNSFRKIKSRCSQYSISISHFNAGKSTRRNKTNYDENEIYSVKSEYPRANLRRRILSEGWLPYFCGSCKIDTWMGKKITLEIEHKNGINDDHRKDNLEWLCPNCHSQTPTFRNSKNRRNTAVA